jgi:hypothetical protein
MDKGTEMSMAEDSSGSEEQPKPNLALRVLDIMVGVWELTGRDLTTNAEIRGQSTFAWLEGGFFLVHTFHFAYGGRAFSGVEYIGYDEQSGRLKTHVFSNQGPGPLEYTWELTEETFTNWFGDIGASNRYKGRFGEDRNTLIGQWEWPGGGYEATMIRVR